MTDLFDEVDDILNNVENEGTGEDSTDLVENNFNETELHNIIAEIENLEKDFTADETIGEVEVETKVTEIPKIITSTPQVETKKTELQMQIDQELEMALQGTLETKEVVREPVMVEAQGQMNLNLAFKIGEETAKLTIDPVKGLIVTMSGVELCINENDGCKVTMDSGVKFIIPLTTADTALKKKSA